MTGWRRALHETLADSAVEVRSARSLFAKAAKAWASLVALGRLILVAMPFLPSEPPLREIGRDIRHGVRRLRRAPGLTILAILTLGLGIGMTTAVFSLMNSVLLKTAPIPEIDRVVAVHFNDRSSRGYANLPYPQYRVVADRATDVFDGMAAMTIWRGAASGNGRAAILAGELVSSQYFSTLRQQPQAGTLVLGATDRDARLVVVISDRLWRDWFSRDARAVGRTLRVNGETVTIAGVAPVGFGGLLLPTIQRVDLWIPLGLADRLGHTFTEPRVWNLNLKVLARPREGIDPSGIATRLSAMTADLPRPPLGAGEPRSLTASPARPALIPADFDLVGRPIGAGLTALAALVLLIACGNLVNVLLARSLVRGREFAIRLATGATRWHLARLHLVETTLLAVGGAAVGLAIVSGLARILSSLSLPPISGLTFTIDFSPDARVLGFSLAIAVITALAVGVVPAWRASRTDPLQSLMAGGPAGDAGRGRTRTVLVAAQVAVSLILLLTAGLFVRSSVAALRHDPGFDLERSALVRVNLAFHGYDELKGRQYFERALQEARALPGVTRAALVDTFPVDTDRHSARFERETDRDRSAPSGRFTRVSPEFFELAGIPIVRGRGFNEADTKYAPRVIVINEQAARELWPGVDPIGQRLALFGKATGWREVVGVARDTDVGMPGDRAMFAFIPFAQDYYDNMGVLVEARNDPESIVEPLRAAMQAVDPEVAIMSAGRADAALNVLRLPIWLASLLLVVLGATGLFIALLGLYGAVAYAVGGRTREIGVRMTLGAHPRDIRRMVLGQSLRMLVAGIAPGLVLAYIGVGLLRNFLFGVEPHDPVTFIVVPLLLAAAGAAAGYLPARRAARIDPNVSLREL